MLERTAERNVASGQCFAADKGDAFVSSFTLDDYDRADDVPSIWIGSVPFVNRQSIEAICLSTPHIGAARPGDDNSITNATKTCPLICFLSFHVCLVLIPYSHEGLYIPCCVSAGFHAASDGPNLWSEEPWHSSLIRSGQHAT